MKLPYINLYINQIVCKYFQMIHDQWRNVVTCFSLSYQRQKFLKDQLTVSSKLCHYRTDVPLSLYRSLSSRFWNISLSNISRTCIKKCTTFFSNVYKFSIIPVLFTCQILLLQPVTPVTQSPSPLIPFYFFDNINYSPRIQSLLNSISFLQL